MLTSATTLGSRAAFASAARVGRRRAIIPVVVARAGAGAAGMDVRWLASKAAASKNKVVVAAAAPKSVADQYTRLSQREHILARPDTYIGTTTKVTTDAWCLDRRSNRIVFKEVTYHPGLYKLFDELLVNAADNRTRKGLCAGCVCGWVGLCVSRVPLRVVPVAFLWGWPWGWWVFSFFC